MFLMFNQQDFIIMLVEISTFFSEALCHILCYEIDMSYDLCIISSISEYMRNDFNL